MKRNLLNNLNHVFGELVNAGILTLIKDGREVFSLKNTKEKTLLQYFSHRIEITAGCP
ncbi:hypothetical protein SAMN05444682_106147 [Parapedobacter indicus]|uniref:Uncharacterized protein n=1 Tax=Parapedobacter indicus TaxID=1477437 RepID=A0A1I3LUZ8_9SPHI|nr:hypothetical protein CLV26_106188 [Parapedobacter indicus]SFI88335.1 hypothetical protein SAMN05444682_106147 [Parapedobacter indicus]